VSAPQVSEPIYNIPLQLWPAYAERTVVVRATDPAALAATLATADAERLLGVQLQALAADSEPLNAWQPGMPIELLMGDPETEFPLLYHHTELQDNHPVRVVIPARPGLAKAVKVALALEFPVRIDPGQPDAAALAELAAVLELYLRQSDVAQPVEYLHSTLLGLYYDDPLPLWIAMDEEPGLLYQVADDGTESLPGRLAGVAPTTLARDAGPLAWIEQLLATAPDCQSCAFRRVCGGYFKWPQRDYDCRGVQKLFTELSAAANELRRDLDTAPS